MTGKIKSTLDWEWRQQIRIVAGIVVVAFTLAGPYILNAFLFRILFLSVMWSGLALSWNLVGGYIRYPSFGHVTFLGLGMFTVGLGGRYYGFGTSFGPGLVGTLVLAGIVSAIVAALIAFPILKLRGAYFGVTTLAIALVVFGIFNNVDVLGGGVGIAAPTFEAPVNSQHVVYYFMLATVSALVGTIVVIGRTQLGYGFAAIRDSEDAAEMIGIPTTRYKVIAFVLSAFFPGIIGGIYAYYLGFFTAGTAFTLEIGIDMIVYTIIGGIGTILGPIVGATLMTALKHMVFSGYQELHVLLTGLFIIIAVLFFPSGIVGVTRSVLSGNTEVSWQLDLFGGDHD